ncbi:MAG: RNA polymerase sigma factor [Candidatus Wildermuthbacteria bacterium]|nr:RNA polymerase sigma factor [Candidatus Wildermuthbacteria bacterium]
MSEDIIQFFGDLYDKFVAKIYRYIFLKVSNRETAEDLVSEAFLRAFKTMKKPGFRAQNPQAFLYQVARNVIADHYRAKNPKTVPLEAAEFQFADDKDSPLQSAEIGLEMAKLQEALALLNGDYQDLIILRYIDEFSNAEISEITGRSEEAVRVGIHRALQALREKLTTNK